MPKRKPLDLTGEDLQQAYECAHWDYSNAVTLAMRELFHSGYRLSPDELKIADGLSLNFRLIRAMTWESMPLTARQDIARARSHKESLRVSLQKQN